jgi:hypothetical protein
MESHFLVVESYGEHTPSVRTCETWFRQIKSGDFNEKDSAHSGRLQKCKDEELQVKPLTQYIIINKLLI